MTRRTNARVAGSMFLLYIVIGITTMIVSRGVPAGEGTAAKLAIMAQHASVYRINMLLGLLTGFIALTLGVALYGITRDEDHELSILALSCRIGEGLSIFFPMFATLGLLWLATDAAAAPGGLALAEFLMKVKGWNVTLAATFFAVGSTIFCWLLLRGRMIPAALAWLGVCASILLVIGLPLRLANLLEGPITYLIWIPMAAFEIPLGVWLIVKGVAAAARPSVAP
jgi:hypothetical protein